ncbi:PKD domain-containing protein [Pseudoalteromonas peptidolytica]|uniref:PKD domain-containing protein n=1 Tax=Pseudoalteromonas peptidolytica TaxID=61150 RepID=UPI00298E325C|nr:PKD domain-containing protein [Pseudoalteromonas peptidolytica]MDW7551212.1 PKD domain-containing protein [Pseudoalteromonas peptidolytica]
MQRQMITAVLGLASGLAMAQAPLTENQMMEYTSKVSKATIGKKYDLHLPLVSQQSPSIANASAAIVQTVSHPGASYIKLHFKNLNLELGGKLIVRSEDNAEYYAYSQDNLRAATIDPTISDDGITQFSAMSVSADKVIVEYIPGAGKTDKTPEIDFYYHGVEGQNYLESATDVTTLSTCGAMERKDVQCWAQSHPVEFERSRPVARLLMNGSGLCTGWRVGADNRMFTNNHCVGSASELANTEVWFNYQNTSCNGSQRETVVKVTGKDFLKTDYTLDYTLFTINDFAKAQPFGYFGLDVRNPSQGERIYIPQHGSGNPKELSIESDQDNSGLCSVNQANANGRGTGTDIGYYCDTIGGSSGSPVLAAATNNVVALHHLGGCTNKGAKISLIWPQVSSHFGGQIPVGDNGTTDPTPIALFTYNCTDLSCSFDGSSSNSPNGAITQYSWQFSDGATASGAQTSHSFTGSGSYNVELTITDNTGATASTSQQVTVSLPGEEQKLFKGVAKSNLSGSSGSEMFFYYDAPAGVNTVTFNISGGTGDADLYVLKGQEPTTSNWTCRPYRYGNNESCNLNEGAGRYWVMIRGYNAYSGLQIVADHN